MLPNILLFLIAFVCSVVLTPRVAAVAERFGLLDRPSARKVHILAVPRIGGVAIFIAFFISIGFGALFSGIQTSLFFNSKVVYVYVGGLVAFGMGFFDDIKQLGPKIKFAIQTVVAIFVYVGGLQIHLVALPFFGPIYFDLLSLPITIFWVLLVVNAINIIDGLDGLAAGVSFFVCLVLTIISFTHGNIMVSILLAALAGSILGFLVFNFNPASIFMGDSGSYFIGYMLASLSILGSLKSHTTFTFLIPIIALGVPLLDTVWATVRRFIVGQKLFKADKNHFHHRLLALGYSQRRAVLILYAITLFLGFVAFMMVNVTDSTSGFLLALLTILVTFFIRRLGYIDFLGVKNILIWINDLVNTLGINRDRRLFFAYQLAIAEAENIQTLRDRVFATAEFLGMDFFEFRLGGRESGSKKFEDFIWFSPDGVKRKEELYANDRLYMRFPLECEGQYFGVMCVSLSGFNSDKSHTQILWRLEFLRRTLASSLQRLKHNPAHELGDRRGQLGNRRINTLKNELIDQLEDRRIEREGDRRSPASIEM